MSLKTQYENADIDNENIVPLGSEQIKSVLKTQSEAVFQDKNISNNSNFIKKSLIDIALDFKSKDSNNEISENKETIKEEGIETKKIDNIINKKFKVRNYNLFLSISDEKNYSIAFTILQTP